MNLIRQVDVKSFRSIANESFGPLESISCLIGRNSSGKSNILRALNLFFNDEVDPGRKLQFGRDYRENRSRQRKEIVIAVHFKLPDNFKIRNKELSSLGALGREFTITRRWSLNARREVVSSMSAAIAGAPIAESERMAEQFIKLVVYRYIPNRTVPSTLLREESQAIASSIFLRMKGEKNSAEFLESLGAAARRMLGDADIAMRASGAPLEGPTITTADTVGEMIQMRGFRANTGDGVVVQDEDWGSGHQAFFLFHVLYSVDTNYGLYFGWRQAVVWGVEEPESGLHRDLETRLAGQFRRWSHDERSKLQIVQTTHSPVFVMSSEAGAWVENAAGGCSIESKAISALVKYSETKGVSGSVHPVLAFPWNPVILVEGPGDAEVLEHVAALTGLHHLRFLSLPELDADERSGGKDSIVKYLKSNRALLSNRPKEAPLVVVLDWEVSKDELEKAKREYGIGGEERVARMDAANASAEMGRDFTGIERFYPPSVVRDAHAANECTVGIAAGRPMSISKLELSRAKDRLKQRVLAIDSLSSLEPLVKVVNDIARIVEGEAKRQLSLPGMGSP